MSFNAEKEFQPAELSWNRLKSEESAGVPADSDSDSFIRMVICGFLFCQAGRTGSIAGSAMISQLARHRNRQNARAGKKIRKEVVDFRGAGSFARRHQPANGGMNACYPRMRYVETQGWFSFLGVSCFVFFSSCWILSWRKEGSCALLFHTTYCYSLTTQG